MARLARKGVRLRSEQCGAYLITASACRLPDLKWQPRLTITRIAIPATLSKSQAFPGLSPTFDSAANEQLGLFAEKSFAIKRLLNLVIF